MTHPEPPPDTLCISFPATSGYLRISRMNATTYAADLGFDVDELDDLRLAIDESVSWLLHDESSGGSVYLELRARDGGLAITGRRRAAHALPARAVGDLAHAIFGATVDHHELDSDDDGRHIELFKAASDRSGSASPEAR